MASWIKENKERANGVSKGGEGRGGGVDIDSSIEPAPTSPAQSRPSTPAEADLHGDLDMLQSRPQLWWKTRRGRTECRREAKEEAVE
jgi:hypothetical protein